MIKRNPQNVIALRMDDVGASTKEFEVYSKKPFGNLLFLKRLNYFKAWGPYREIHENEWIQILELLSKFKSKLTVGITAAWVERNGEINPFNKKFSKNLRVLKEGVENDLLEIANHGLTHCIEGKHLPRYFSSNRQYHREFYDYLPENLHHDHIKKSQEILNECFGVEITTFIPPGNVYSMNTVTGMKKNGLKVLNSSIKINGIKDEDYLDEENIVPFHDRELVVYGLDWFKKLLQSFPESTKFQFIRDLKKHE